jgi:hypothetical protein
MPKAKAADQRPAGALAAVVLALAVSGCASGSPTSSPAASGSSEPSATTAASESATSSTPPGADVGFATVVADRVNMRDEPSIHGAVITEAIADCPAPCTPLQVGQATPYPELYLLDGPVQADGYAWYLAATTTEDSISPEYIGWVAAGDESGPWLVLHEPECPQPPIELSDITYQGLSRFEAIACFSGQDLTVRGWYVALPADAEPPGECSAQPAWLVCGWGYHMLRPQPSGYYGDANNLPMKVDPASNVNMPPRGNWVVVTGMFDHPAAEACGTDAQDQVAFRLQCRMEFVVTAARLA